MSAADNLVNNSDKIANTNYYDSDKVVFADTSDFSVTNSPGTYSFNISTNIDTMLCNPVGIFSIDGGTTWTDIGGLPLTGSLAKNITLPPVVVTPRVYTDGHVTYRVTVNSSVGSDTTFTLRVSVCLLAPLSNQGILHDIPPLANQKIAMSSIDTTSEPIFYRQVMAEQSYTNAVGTAAHTIPHNLGYVPDTSLWMTDSAASGNPNTILGIHFDARFQGNGSPLFAMDNTNFYIFDNTTTKRYIYRTYKP